MAGVALTSTWPPEIRAAYAMRDVLRSHVYAFRQQKGR
jgi:hypothetical protein